MSAQQETTGEITSLPLGVIGRDQGVRSESLDLDHVARLGEVLDLLPPIVVRFVDERYELIDGAHRVAAHRLGGRDDIAAMVVSVSDVRAVEWATSANVTHGRPLTVPDRKRAAERLMAMDPDMSDRSIAASCGLAPTTVAALRSTVQSGQLNTPEPRKRTGSDGKKRPTPEQAKESRAKAEAIAAEHPDISTRALAEEAGVSTGTAADVKKSVTDGRTRGHLRDVSATDEQRDEPPTVAEVVTPIPTSWSKHPAAKRSNDGRDFCGWMDRRSIRGEDPETVARTFAAKVPAELLDQAEAAARVQAGVWLAFADDVAARRNRETP